MWVRGQGQQGGQAQADARLPLRYACMLPAVPAVLLEWGCLMMVHEARGKWVAGWEGNQPSGLCSFACHIALGSVYVADVVM